MPGIAQGFVSGFDSAQRAMAQAAQINIEQQQVTLAQQRQDKELERQSNLDKISQLQERINSIANQAKPLFGYLDPKNAPVDPQKDPEGFAKWQDGDDYKSHLAQAKDYEDQLTPLIQQKQKVQNDIIGIHTDQMKDQAAQDLAAIRSGTKQPQDLSGESITNMLTLKSGMDPSAFLADKNGQMPIDRYNQVIQKGIQTGDWSNAGPALAALNPHLNAAIGHQLAGGTVTGVTVNTDQNGQPGVHMNPDDRRKLHFQPLYQVHMPDGSIQLVPGPEKDESLPVTLDQLGKRATNMQQLARFAQHPEIQAKVQQAFQDRATPFHKLHDDLLGAGVPPNELLQAPYDVKGVAGGYVTSRPGEKPEFTQTVKPRTPAELQEIQSRMDATGEDYGTAEANVDALKHGYSTLRNPNVRPAGGGAAGGGKVRVGDRKDAVSAAIDAVAGEYDYHKAPSGENKGQWVDAKGKVVQDHDFTASLDKIKANGIAAKSQDDLKKLDPDAGQRVPKTNGVWHPSTVEQYKKLKPGAHYIGKDGKTVMVKGG